MKNRNGITLIALIITIIVLLILAGITISLVVGDNGILSKSTQAKTDSIIAQEKEQVNLAYNAAFTKKLGDTVTREELQDELDKVVGEGKTTVTGTTTFKVKFKETNNEYSISQNGKVGEYEKPEVTSVYVTVCQNGYLVFSNNEADINNYLAENNTSLSDGYEIRDIRDDAYIDYYYDEVNDVVIENLPTWTYDYSIEYAIFLNRIVPKTTAFWFYNLTDMVSIENIQNLDTSNVTDMTKMFAYANSLTSLDLSGFDTSKVTNMSGMFMNCVRLTSLDLSSFDTSKVTNMSDMFCNCSSLENLDISSFDTSNVTDMGGMFHACENLISLNLRSFNTSKVETIASMFHDSVNLVSLDLSSFDTSNVTDMQAVFSDCHNLTSLDLSNFDTSNVTDALFMFNDCTVLTTIYVKTNWNTSNMESSSLMFKNCTSLVGGNGTTYSDSNPSDKTYARIDEGTSNPGYFTLKSN